MFGFISKKVDETFLIFKREKEEYIEPEAIKKNSLFIEEQITRLLILYRQKYDLHLLNKHSPLTFSEDEHSFFITITLLTPISQPTLICDRLFEDIREFFYKHKQFKYKEVRAKTTYETALEQSYTNKDVH